MGLKIAGALAVLLVLSFLLFLLLGPYFRDNPSVILLEKPVLYLYPEAETQVTVKLGLDGPITFAYPAYGDGWRVTARPDGTLTDPEGGEYGSLFGESVGRDAFDLSAGFVAAGGDTVAFLREKLAFMGLSPRECSDFIVYWAPRMSPNPYNLIAFQGAAYTDAARLDITPAPDSLLRVFMAFKPLKRPVSIPEPALAPFERVGFTAAKRGGAQVK